MSDRIKAKTASEMKKVIFPAIFSSCSFFIFLFIFFNNTAIPSFKRKPPSRGIAGWALNVPKAKFNQKIQ